MRGTVGPLVASNEVLENFLVPVRLLRKLRNYQYGCRCARQYLTNTMLTASNDNREQVERCNHSVTRLMLELKCDLGVEVERQRSAKVCGVSMTSQR